jgi:hypothetical protein
MICCGCGRRLFGTSRRNNTVTYYLCWPRKNNRGRPDTHAEHPKTVYLNEETALDAVAAFYAERVFGPRRRELLAAELAGLDDHAGRQGAADRQRLTRALADIERRQANLPRQAQDGDPGDPFATGLRQTHVETRQPVLPRAGRSPSPGLDRMVSTTMPLARRIAHAAATQEGHEGDNPEEVTAEEGADSEGLVDWWRRRRQAR